MRHQPISRPCPFVRRLGRAPPWKRSERWKSCTRNLRPAAPGGAGNGPPENIAGDRGVGAPVAQPVWGNCAVLAQDPANEWAAVGAAPCRPLNFHMHKWQCACCRGWLQWARHTKIGRLENCLARIAETREESGVTRKLSGLERGRAGLQEDWRRQKGKERGA